MSRIPVGTLCRIVAYDPASRLAGAVGAAAAEDRARPAGGMMAEPVLAVTVPWYAKALLWLSLQLERAAMACMRVRGHVRISLP